MSAVTKGASTAGEKTVRLSLVVAMYKVARYLPEFLLSLDEQDLDGVALECIFVDDGSPEDEAQIAQAWLERTGTPGRVIRKENGGVSSARNAGIAEATGEWVSFPDPDDILAPGYLREVASYAGSSTGSRADVLATKIVFYFEDKDELRDTHPLTFKFEKKPQNLSLIGTPHAIQLSSSSAFVRLETLRSNGLTFDERLRVGEDAMLLSQVFALNPSPALGVIPSAEYRYRKRAMQDSALDQSQQRPEHLLDRMELGYLPLAQQLQSAGRLQEWFAQLVLYDIGWAFKPEMTGRRLSSAMTDAQKQRTLELTRQILALFEPEWLFTTIRPALPYELRLLWDVLRREALDERLPDALTPVRMTSYDQGRNLMQLRYYTSTAEPAETILMGGRPVRPRAAKTRTIDYFGQRSMFERILWVSPSGWLRVEVDGRLQPLAYSQGFPRYSAFRADYQRHFRVDDAPEPTPSMSRRIPRRGRSLSRPLQPSTRRRHQKAWLFMDRIGLAQDNAEHLYRHVRRTHPQINAWFVLDPTSTDWSRLKRDGFRLVAYRSRLHLQLLLDAEHVISSHIDHEMTNPLPNSAYPNGTRPWLFTFLQHGVTKDDLSRWLNHKPISTFVTATRPERESIAGDLTPYVFSDREVVLSGFPRHDALLKKAEAAQARGERNYLLIAPTWRDGLFAPKRAFEARQLVADIGSSDYVQSWSALLNSQAVRDAASAHGLKVVFLPHPQMREIIDHLKVPEWVELRDYTEGDVQEVLSRAALLVTDYSSIAFDIAYAGMPTVYFQFDRDAAFSGAHIYSRGYFSYDDHGFGPVSLTVQEAAAEVTRLLSARAESGDWPEPYLRRITETFAFRDGKNSARVLKAIIASRPSSVPPPLIKRLPRVRKLLRPVRRRVRRMLGR